MVDLEDGYTRIANDLIISLVEANLTKREWVIIMVVARKTYGYQKKEDDMTMTQLASISGMDLGNVSKTIRILEEKRILLKRQGRYGYVIGINSKTNQWCTCQNNKGVVKTTSSPCQNDNSGLSKRQTQKKTPKENSKRKPSRQENKFSDEDMRFARWMFSLIQQLNPNHREPSFEAWANTVRLIRERDKRNIREMAEVFKWANDDDFWKTNILSPTKLREQYDKLATKMLASMPERAESKPWNATASGIESKAIELGINPADYDGFPALKAEVFRRMEAA